MVEKSNFFFFFFVFSCSGIGIIDNVNSTGASTHYRNLQRIQAGMHPSRPKSSFLHRVAVDSLGIRRPHDLFDDILGRPTQRRRRGRR